MNKPRRNFSVVAAAAAVMLVPMHFVAGQQQPSPIQAPDRHDKVEALTVINVEREAARVRQELSRIDTKGVKTGTDMRKQKIQYLQHEIAKAE